MTALATSKRMTSAVLPEPWVFFNTTDVPTGCALKSTITSARPAGGSVTEVAAIGFENKPASLPISVMLAPLLSAKV